VTALWNKLASDGTAATTQFSISWHIGRTMPPGLIERLVTALNVLGEFQHAWRGGCVLRVQPAMKDGTRQWGSESEGGARLLCEHRKRPESGGHQIFAEIVGQNGEALWKVLHQVERIGTGLLEHDFAGIIRPADFWCPTCTGKDTPKSSWPFRGFKPVTCENCEEKLGFKYDAQEGQQERAGSTELAVDILLPLEGYNRDAARDRLILPFLRAGELEKSQRLFKLLGLADRRRLKELKAEGEEAIAAEMVAFNCKEKDQFGWCDLDWLRYFREKIAGGSSLPTGASSLDEANEGMGLGDFARHPVAIAAGLDRPMVLALRLYSSSVHININKHLRLSSSAQRRHPYPALVMFLMEAIMLLRQYNPKPAEAPSAAPPVEPMPTCAPAATTPADTTAAAAKKPQRAPGSSSSGNANRSAVTVGSSSEVEAGGGDKAASPAIANRRKSSARPSEAIVADPAAVADPEDQGEEEGDKLAEEAATEVEIPAEDLIPGDADIVFKLTLKNAVGLMAADRNGFSDPFVKIDLGKEERKSKVRYKTLNPVWNALFAYKGTKDEVFAAHEFKFTIFDYDGQGAKSDKIGSAALSLDQVAKPGTEVEIELNAADPKVPDSCGVLNVVVRWDLAGEEDEEPEFVPEPGISYCCVRELDPSDNGVFANRCGTELGFMSVTRSREVAIEKAKKTSPQSVVLKLIGHESDPALQGANISFFSMSSRDHEVIYPPGIFLQYLSEGVVQEEEQAPGGHGKPGASKAAEQAPKITLLDVALHLS